jgi:hypothetical protein
MAKPTKMKSHGAAGLYSLKKCPYCFEMLNLEADRCGHCKKKVGKINKTGFAEKPTNWKAYIISLAAWAAFAFYVWWAFFERK